MADFDKRTTTTVRHEYVLRSPTPVGELQKAIAAALADRESILGRAYSDDACMVEGSDDLVVVWWDEADR